MSLIRMKRDYYVNRSGGVNRRVTKFFGNGQSAVTSDYEVAESLEDFRASPANEGVSVTGVSVAEEPEREDVDVNPEAYTVRTGALADFLDGIDSVDRVIELSNRDGRKTATQFYNERIKELIAANFNSDEDEENAEETVEEALNDEEDEE